MGGLGRTWTDPGSAGGLGELYGGVVHHVEHGPDPPRHQKSAAVP